MGGFRGNVPAGPSAGGSGSGIPPRPVPSPRHSGIRAMADWDRRYGGRVPTPSTGTRPLADMPPTPPPGTPGGAPPSNLAEWRAGMAYQPGPPRPVPPTPSPGHSRAGDIAAARAAGLEWDQRWQNRLDPATGQRTQPFQGAQQQPTPPRPGQLPVSPGPNNGGLTPGGGTAPPQGYGSNLVAPGQMGQQPSQMGPAAGANAANSHFATVDAERERRGMPPIQRSGVPVDPRAQMAQQMSMQQAQASALRGA